MSKEISLVLGSGGARGYAHIGVIEVLLEKGYRIKSIAGSSMGALVGGLYICGTLKEFKEWVLSFKTLDFLKYADFTFGKAGFIKGDKIFQKMSSFLKDVNIEDLPISYTAVATDLFRQKEVWFQRGSLKTAIRASVAIPTVFTPVKFQNTYLVDGGILNPVPIAPTISDHTDLTVAVNPNGQAQRKYWVPTPAVQKKEPGKFAKKMSELWEKAGIPKKSKERGPEEFQEKLRYFEVISLAFQTMQNSLSQYKIAGYSPDVLIEFPRDACGIYDFHKASPMIELGRAIASESLEAYEKSKNRSSPVS